MSALLSSFGLSLSAQVEDILLLLLLLLPALILGYFVVRASKPGKLVRALLWRFRWTNLLFIALIAVSVGLGVGLIAQERGLRRGSARAAEKFDLVITAPGSEVTMTLASVYLQPSDAPLLSGALYDEIANHKDVDIAAPLAYGDSYNGSPVVGSTAAFVQHLSGSLQKGQIFGRIGEAVVGAQVPLAMGAQFTPAHGHGKAAKADTHAGIVYTVTGRMQATGSPWDKAIVVPVEAVWQAHNLPVGHAPTTSRAGADIQIGPPFDPAHFPGTPAIMVHAKKIWANYALKSQFTSAQSMAFFPGTVLAQMHRLLGDVRQLMSALAGITEVLVAAGVLAGLATLLQLFARRLALLRALGAPQRFVFAVVWAYAALLIIVGALLGLLVGMAATMVISTLITAHTNILVEAQMGMSELHLVAGFVSLALTISLTCGWAALRRPVLKDLRG
ncbi:FtsX-like permease family protein [Polycladidibacter stylochi]|uniref:FtsX-like permease family protein n=1 Tax=Polycladidibacter stylochi TaxID=1807766 RepID=UPI00082AF53E|nr:ABC transporter permease [Pseudovibrio stylochi]